METSINALYICITIYDRTIHKYMRLTQTALLKINNPRVRVALAYALGFTEQWVIRLIEANKDNGPLTTIKALSVINGETGLVNSEILEEEPVIVKS